MEFCDKVAVSDSFKASLRRSHEASSKRAGNRRVLKSIPSVEWDFKDDKWLEKELG